MKTHRSNKPELTRFVLKCASCGLQKSSLRFSSLWMCPKCRKKDLNESARTSLILLICFLLFALCSCKKAEVKPAPPREYKCLFNWNTEGFVNEDPGHCVTYPDPYGPQFAPHVCCGVLVVDSCAISVNGVLTYSNTYGYHLQFKPGDVIDVYLRGRADSTKAERVFSIWQDYNGPYNITSFRAVGDVITGRFVAVNMRVE